jgi:hypothetical protein
MLKNLFGDAPADRAVGQEIESTAGLIRSSACSNRWDRSSAFSRDNVVYIPYSTYQKGLRRQAFARRVYSGATAEQLEAAEDQVRTVMRNRRGHRPDDRVTTKASHSRRRMCF